MKIRSQRGFTLIELLVVIGIIGILAALLLPALMGARKSARRTDCKNNLKSIGVFFSLYQSKYDNFPPLGPSTWFAAIWSPDLAADGNLFRCAVRGRTGIGTHYEGILAAGTWTPPAGTGNPAYTFGAWGIGAAAPPDMPVAADAATNHGSNSDMNVLFFQGRVEDFPASSPMFTATDQFLGATTWAAPKGTE